MEQIKTDKKPEEVRLNQVVQPPIGKPEDAGNYSDFIQEISGNAKSVEEVKERLERAKVTLAKISEEEASIGKKDAEEQNLLREIRQGLKMPTENAVTSNHSSYVQKSDSLFFQSGEIKKITKQMEDYLASQPKTSDEGVPAVSEAKDGKVKQSETSQETIEYMGRMKNNFSRLADDLSGVENLLRRNDGFRNVNLQTENFPRLVRNDSMQPKELEEAFDFLNKEFNRSLVSEDGRERLMIQPEDFSRLVLKLGEVQERIHMIRKQLEEYPEEDPKKANFEDIMHKTDDVNITIEKQKDELQTMRKALDRYLAG